MKALFIGLGGIGQRHARNLRAILGNSVELLAYRVRKFTRVVTPKLEVDSARDVEQEYAIRAFSDLPAALAERPDVAFVCNPSNMHIPAALACLEAGCDIFVEKPLSISMDGVNELINAAEQKQRIAMVGFQLRFHPGFVKLGAIIASGRLGHILAVRATIGEYLPNWHRYEDYRQMYAARADLGGGVVLSQIHELDYLYALFGLPRRLYAIGGHWSHLHIDVEDIASVLMEAESEGRSLPVHLHQDYLQSPPTRQCEVIGDRGKAILDFSAPTVTVYDSSDGPPAVDSFPDFDRNQLFIDEMRHFLNCVEKRSRPMVGLRDGLQSLRMALAIKQSIATGKLVELSSADGQNDTT